VPKPAQGPHVLYVAWGFPPCRGGGVYRALATANQFAAAGFRVTVLTATRETFLKYTGADTSLESELDPAVRVVRVPFSWPNLECDVRQWGAARALAPRLWTKARRRLDTRLFPEVVYGPWKAPLEAAAKDIHAEAPVDLVVATANPHVDFTVADYLHRVAGVPYVMDYRDAWLLNVFEGTQLVPDSSRESRLERQYVSSAREIWFVNEPIRQWHQARYRASADRMHVVANGYDGAFAPTPRRSPPPPDKPLNFGYIGTVSPKVPLADFAAGWSLARSREALTGATAEIWGYLGFYATPSPALKALVDSHAQDGLRYAGPLAKRRVPQVYDTFDVCLLILGKGRYVTSGKVFEYAASALPIVSVHDPDNAASDVLRDYPLWFPVPDLSPEAVAAALEAAADAARHASEGVREECRVFSARYARDLQLAPRVQALKASVLADRESGDGR
jgi:glycosyltransferase involved in cell wall biosynthesis